jgi:hypothetical protein
VCVHLEVHVVQRHEDVSLLERCPHFRGCYVQASMASMELGPGGVLISEGVMYRLQ